MRAVIQRNPTAAAIALAQIGPMLREHVRVQIYCPRREHLKMLARTFTQIILSECANSVDMFERANAAWLILSTHFVRNEKRRGRVSYFAPP